MPDRVPNTPGRAELVDMFVLALERLKKQVFGEMTVGSDRARAARRIIAIQREIKRLKKESATWAARWIPKAYEIGLHQDDKILERLAKLSGDNYDSDFSKLHTDAAAVIAQGAAIDFSTTADALEQTFSGYVRRAQVEEARAAIAREIGSGIIEGESRDTVTKRLLDDLRERATDGIITVGKATMSVDKYADLLVRTVSRAARTEGTLNRLKEHGLDLVRVSNTGAVDFCRIYEDQIFSLSGKDTRFPVLTQRPPYHPNCTHTLSAFVEVFADNGEVESGQQFLREDNGKSAAEMAKKYPIERDDTRAMTRKTQRAA